MLPMHEPCIYVLIVMLWCHYTGRITVVHENAASDCMNANCSPPFTADALQFQNVKCWLDNSACSTTLNEQHYRVPIVVNCTAPCSTNPVSFDRLIELLIYLIHTHTHNNGWTHLVLLRMTALLAVGAIQKFDEKFIKIDVAHWAYTFQCKLIS